MNMNLISYNRVGLALLVSLFTFVSFAEIPAGYYSTAIGKKGESLQQSLSSILSDASVVSYNGLYDVYKTSDVRADGRVWDMYSDMTNYTFSDKCGNYSSEGDCFNREHSVPKSWFDSQSPMYSDAWHVYPTDGKINGMRSNYPFGEVGSDASGSHNNFSKWGSCVTAGYSGTVFEPNDEYKGDFARSYFYFATRYKNDISGWGGIFTTTYPHIVKWQLDMLLRWHKMDPVSQKELDRNEAIYASNQGNRNPYIDYPDLVDLVFGDRRTEAFNPYDEEPYLEMPEVGTSLHVGTVSVNVAHSASARLAIKGQQIEGAVTLSVSGDDASCFSVAPSSVSASEVNAGIEVEISYYSAEVGAHTATLNIAGGGLNEPTTVALTGNAVDDFVALPAKNVTMDSFVAAWTPRGGATDYELHVWYDDYSSSTPEQDILNVAFSEKPDTWSYEGYVSIDNGALRLGSSSQNGVATTPSLDLSGDNVVITVEASPYRNDESTLYVSVDGAVVDEIDLSKGTVTKTVPVQGGTSSSKVSFMAKSKLRAYLHQVTITVGGGAESITLSGYPRRVGNETEYAVTGLSRGVQYHYTVTPYVGDGAQSVSNTISVVTATTGIDDMESDHILIFMSQNALHIINAPMNAVAEWYTMDGRLCGTRILHADEEAWNLPAGIYLVRVISPQMQTAVRVYSAR